MYFVQYCHIVSIVEWICCGIDMIFTLQLKEVSDKSANFKSHHNLLHCSYQNISPRNAEIPVY